jgi:hypothetical protein
MMRLPVIPHLVMNGDYMRNLVLTLFGVLFIASSQASNHEKAPLCSAFYFKSVKAKLLESTNDKYMHCAVSCMLAKRCGALDSYQIGVLKEVWDLFTPGDADLKDIEADLIGIRFYTQNRKISDSQCNQKCIRYDFR